MLTPPRFHWTQVPTIAAGIFLGGYWAITAAWSEVGPGIPWWRAAAALAPGTAILILTALARRAPVPYGAGLIVLGTLPLLPFGSRGPWDLRLAFGLPLIAVGAGFILWRRQVTGLGKDDARTREDLDRDGRDGRSVR